MKKQDTQKQEDAPVQDTKAEEEWKQKYLRVLADYQNLEKRTHIHIEEVRRYASELVLSRMLPIVDTLESAQKHLKDSGLEMVLRQMHTTLTELGVKKIDVLEKVFNPHEMDCIEVVEGNENMVVEEVSPGYTLHDRILRVAKVKVGKKKVADEQIL